MFLYRKIQASQYTVLKNAFKTQREEHLFTEAAASFFSVRCPEQSAGAMLSGELPAPRTGQWRYVLSKLGYNVSGLNVKVYL